MKAFDIYPLGDQAITLSIGNSIHEKHHLKIMAMKAWLAENPIHGILDIIIAYNSITLFYDLYKLKSSGDLSGSTAFEYVSEKLQQAFEQSGQSTFQQKHWRIPVCYEGSFAPDLPYVASVKGLTTEKVIALHTARRYRVYMIGFLPGFLYMAEVSAEIATPRKVKPAARVAAGSVGIAGIQTGIYPVASPGGWQIIGRTPWRMFDVHANPPVRFEPGDDIEFYSITQAEFYDIAGKP